MVIDPPPDRSRTAEAFVPPPANREILEMARGMYELADRLEPTLDEQQRALMHCLRVAAEQLGATVALAHCTILCDTSTPAE